MMKRIVLLVVLAGIFGFQSHGQLQYGAKAGLMTASSNLDEEITNLPDKNYDKLKMEAMEAKAGFQAGFFGRLSILGIYVQPELMYSSTNSRIKVTKQFDSQDPEEFIKTQSFNRFDIPLLVGGKFGPFRVQGGPVGSFILSEESAIEAALDEETVEEKFNSATWGYQVGIGADFFNFLTLDLKYEGSLSKLGDNVTISGQDYPLDSRTSQFIFTAGIFF